MDNFSGVSSLMNAYFSSKLPRDRVHCKVTYGEEKSINGVYYAGARDVMTRLKANDLVAVIDVTGSSARQLNADTVSQAPNLRGHVIIEKVGHNPITRALLSRLTGQCLAHDGYPVEGNDSSTLAPYTYETYTFCDDPQAFQDETDAYKEVAGVHVMFLGLPTCGGEYDLLKSSGDYNAEPVFCWRKDIEAMTLLVIDLSNCFVKYYDEIVLANS